MPPLVLKMVAFPLGLLQLTTNLFYNFFQLQLIKSFNSSPYVTLCAENISSTLDSISQTQKAESRRDKGDFFSNILYECVTNEKLDIYEDYVSMEKVKAYIRYLSVLKTYNFFTLMQKFKTSSLPTAVFNLWHQSFNY